MTDNNNLADNLIRRLRDAVVYTNLAEKSGISTTAKSAYLRAAIMVHASIVEGLVFWVIRKQAGLMNPSVGKYTQHKNVQKIINPTFSGFPGLALIMDEEKDIFLESRQCGFEVMNKYCLEKGIVNQREFQKLEYVRKKRNVIHIHTLNGSDRGYTSAVLNRMNQAIDVMISKLPLYPSVPVSATSL